MKKNRRFADPNRFTTVSPNNWRDSRSALSQRPIGELISELNRDLKHLVWFDYDGPLTATVLDDVSTSTSFLSVGSIVLVTVDVEPPVRDAGPPEWRKYFEQEGGDWFDRKLRPPSFAESELPRRKIDLLTGAWRTGLLGRTGVTILPLFNFLYADGHTMLTLGAMIAGNDERRRIAASRLPKEEYFCKDFADPPCLIEVPRLTRKERQYLDAHMPCSDEWHPTEFEIKPEYVQAYRKVYRYCPSFAELMH